MWMFILCRAYYLRIDQNFFVISYDVTYSRPEIGHKVTEKLLYLVHSTGVLSDSFYFAYLCTHSHSYKMARM